MNDFQIVQQEIIKLFPQASVTVDPTEEPTGSSWIDIESDGQTVTIEHKPSIGFGLYATHHESYGSGPEEIYRSSDSLLKRIEMLVRRHKEDVKLKDLRELLGKTQEQFSVLSGIKQPSISKLENREDIQLSTLLRYIKLLGGRLEVTAHFKEFDLPINLDNSNDVKEN